MSAHTPKSQPKPKQPYRQRQLNDIAARWDDRADTWDRALEDPLCYLNEDDAYNRFLQEAWNIIDRRRAFCAHHGLIDAGCGTGLVLAGLISAFAWGVGVDISPRMIRLARAKKIPRARFRLSDCYSLAQIRPKAGAVVSRGVLLSHYGEALGLRLLRVARQALAPYGFIMFDFLNEQSKSTHIHLPEDKIYYTPRQAVALARQAGFTKTAICGAPERRVRILLAELP
ncbi:MAG: methyltransferase domain-containing protein [Verrucomicrobiota bacterium]